MNQLLSLVVNKRCLSLSFTPRPRGTSSFTQRPMVHEISPWDLRCVKFVSETKGTWIFTLKLRLRIFSLHNQGYVKFLSESKSTWSFTLRKGYMKFSWDKVVCEISLQEEGVHEISLWHQQVCEVPPSEQGVHEDSLWDAKVYMCSYTSDHLMRRKGILSLILRQRGTCTENVNKCQYPCTFIQYTVYLVSSHRSWVASVIWTSV
jgi:hypothetical protein